MKTKFLSLFLFFFLTSIVDGFCAYIPITVDSVTYNRNVNLFDLFEVSFLTDTPQNPYDPDSITVYGVFIGPDNERDTVLGFYYECYNLSYIEGYEHASANPSANRWKVRFTPDKVGAWSFYLTGYVSIGTTPTPPEPQTKTMFSFNCLAVNEADGFISVANSRYLKRDAVRNGQRQFRSFFPIGPNIPWYSLKNDSLEKPKGFHYYERYVDSLYNNCNYMRVWLSRYQALSLYGPEYTQTDQDGNPVVYFDNTINQKDATELDTIITYAQRHGINVMLCLFTRGDFTLANDDDPSDSSIWMNNPYSNIVDFPCDFFTDTQAKRITRNLVRYIVARWGYATNIVAWELWNEVSNMFGLCNMEQEQLEDSVVKWHETMAAYIRQIDPFGHCVTTSMGHPKKHYAFYSELFDDMDFVQQHSYDNIQKAISKDQSSKRFLDTCLSAHAVYPTKPFFMGEFGFGEKHASVRVKDPYGVDLHNFLWSSLFSSSMGTGSPWRWDYQMLDTLFRLYNPVLTFSRNLPVLSGTFQGYTTGEVIGGRVLQFPNNIETYYMKNAAEDTIFGWCQDTAFAYQSLRWLTDSLNPIDHPEYPWHFKDSIDPFDPGGYVYTMDELKKPAPSSNSNTVTIPITSQPANTNYAVRWYNAETGAEYIGCSNYRQVQQEANGDKYITITFPTTVRNQSSHTVTNRFGDAVFTLTKYYSPKKDD